MTGGGGGKKGRLLQQGEGGKLCGCVVFWESEHWSFCLSASPLREQRGDKVKLSNFCSNAHTKCVTYTCTAPLCQHLLSLLPTPANYSFTFSWMLYQGMPSHYSSQLATAKGRLLHTATRLKVSSHTAGHCHRPWALWVRSVYVYQI